MTERKTESDEIQKKYLICLPAYLLKQKRGVWQDDIVDTFVNLSFLEQVKRY